MTEKSEKHLAEYIQHEFEEICQEMCDKYCKYPEMEPPEGKGCDWLYEDDSPCQKCPLNRL